MTDRVVLASSPNPTYAFFYPITVAMWRHIGGREPICLLTGDADEWQSDPCTALVLEALRHRNADVHFVGQHGNWSPASVAQIGRLFGYLFAREPSDDVVTSDVDMWPLTSFPRRDVPFWASRPAGWPYLSICYLQARVSTWAEAMGVPLGTSFAVAIAQVAARLNHHPPGWSHDEWLSTTSIGKWVASRDPGSLVIGERANNCSGTRLDRDGWPLDPIDLAGHIDAHVLRPGWPDATWARLLWVLQQKLPPKVVEWIEQYRAQYRDCDASG